jgi:hypothetical protein
MNWRRCRATAVYCSRNDQSIFWWASRKPKGGKKLGQDSLCPNRKRNRDVPEFKYRVSPLHQSVPLPTTDKKFIPQTCQLARQSRLPTRCASIEAEVLNPFALALLCHIRENFLVWIFSSFKFYTLAIVTDVKTPIILHPERFAWQRAAQRSSLFHSAVSRDPLALVQCIAVDIRFFTHDI